MILFFRLLAWTGKFIPTLPVWLDLAGLLSLVVCLVLGIVWIFVGNNGNRSNTKNLKRSSP
jgi:hypothetical protein